MASDSKWRLSPSNDKRSYLRRNISRQCQEGGRKEDARINEQIKGKYLTSCGCCCCCCCWMRERCVIHLVVGKEGKNKELGSFATKCRDWSREVFTLPKAPGWRMEEIMEGELSSWRQSTEGWKRKEEKRKRKKKRSRTNHKNDDAQPRRGG